MNGEVAAMLLRVWMSWILKLSHVSSLKEGKARMRVGRVVWRVAIVA